MFQNFKVSINGLAPLLMHNGRLNDKRSPFALELSRCVKLGKKADEWALKAEDVEWCGGLYHSGTAEIQDGVVTWDPSARVIVPADNLWACIVEGATVCKMGTAMKAALLIDDDAALKYDGPADINALAGLQSFRSRKRVKVGQAGVMRTRPLFDPWSVSFVVSLETDQIDPDALRAALTDAGLRKGMGDWTPRYGRFELTSIKAA
jgi:hypothetical protein